VIGGDGARALAIWGALSLAGPARPAAADAQDPRAREAHKACVAGEVDRGIKLLADYLISTEDVTAVYNMGRCYQQNGMNDKALLQFREYRRLATGLSDPERQQLEGKIAELEAEQRSRALTPLEAAERADQSSGDGADGRALRTAGIATAAVGAASLGAGLVFGLRVHALDREATLAMRHDPARDASARTAQTLQWVMYGVGAAALMAGGVLYYVAGARERRVVVTPWLARGGGGAMLGLPL
jgi:hypothetical protein